MPGFFVSNIKSDIVLRDLYPDRCMDEWIEDQAFTACRNTLNKFMLDKTLSWDGNFLVVAEGYLLNKTTLFSQYNAKDINELAIKMYKQEGETFFNIFRGSFSGVFFDKSEDKWLIYTNHTGESPVFYALFDGEFHAGSQVTYLIEALRKTDHSLHFDEDGAYQILTFGFMERDNTFAQEIRRLRGGTYLRIEQGKAEVCEYHIFHKHPERFKGKSENDIIDELDAAFRNAVELEYKKDEEYGYRHLADMSGGLDSRMSAWVAHEMKPRHIQLLTYCKANYLDELIAKQVAQYWKDEILVKPLDDLSFLYDIDEIISMNGGLSFYLGITGGKRMLSNFRTENYGLEHTGMIGDVVIGSFYKDEKESVAVKKTGRYSEKLAHRLKESDSFKSSFEDHEIYLIYTRAIQGAAITSLIRNNYIEMASPFMNVDFLQFCLDIPVKLRIDHHLYKKWILTKYPEAAKYKWEKTNAKIYEPRLICELKYVLNRAPNYLLKKIGRQSILAAGMNPIDYWLHRNESAKSFWNDYFRENFPSFKELATEQLADDVQELYLTGNANEKAMALTVLSAVKLYFCNDK